MCTKLNYENRKQARRVVAILKAKGRNSLQVYRCMHCGKFHLGNLYPSARARKRSFR